MADQDVRRKRVHWKSQKIAVDEDLVAENV